MDAQEGNDLVGAPGEDFDPVVDDGLEAEEIAHGVGEGQGHEGGVCEGDDVQSEL